MKIETVEEFNEPRVDYVTELLCEYYNINNDKSIPDILDRSKNEKAWIKDSYFQGSLILRHDFKSKREEPLEFYQLRSDMLNITEEFIEDDDKGSFRSFLHHCAIIENKVAADYIFTSKGEDVVISKGSKVSKSLKRFIHDRKQLRKSQDAYSALIQKNLENVDYSMYLSIHPYDYLTISENDRDWGSCHSLGDDYFFGNFSYMGDASTMVAYILKQGDSFEDYQNGSFEWNSKIWRRLVHIDKTDGRTTIIQSKQYPFQSDILSKKLTEMLSEVFSKGDKKVEPCYGAECKDIYKAGKESLFFTDLRGKDYQTVAMFDYPIERTGTSSFFAEGDFSYQRVKIGSSFQCIECGEHCATESENGLCFSCNEMYDEDYDCEYCADCGKLFHSEDMIYTDGEMYCESCISKTKKHCPTCGDYFDKNSESDLCEDCTYHAEGRKLVFLISDENSELSIRNERDLARMKEVSNGKWGTYAVATRKPEDDGIDTCSAAYGAMTEISKIVYITRDSLRTANGFEWVSPHKISEYIKENAYSAYLKEIVVLTNYTGFKEEYLKQIQKDNPLFKVSVEYLKGEKIEKTI